MTPTRPAASVGPPGLASRRAEFDYGATHFLCTVGRTKPDAAPGGVARIGSRPPVTCPVSQYARRGAIYVRMTFFFLLRPNRRPAFKHIPVLA